MRGKEKFSGFGVIGGSKAFLSINGDWGNCISSRKIKTPFGISSPLHIYEKDEIRFAFISRHGEKGYEIAAPFINYRANIFAMKSIGVKRIISWSGPGIINDKKLKVGELYLPDDVLDETKHRKDTFFERGGIGFVRQNPVFCNELYDFIKKTLRSMKIRFKSGGIYVCTEGPRLETVAEIKKYKVLGGDVVGMTIAPECFLARELEICYHSICYLTNLAEGIGEKKSFKPGVLFEGMQDEKEAKKVSEIQQVLPEIIFNVIKSFAENIRTCVCPDYMLRYKKRGVLDSEWRKWF
ncbi:MAG: MTAP family purine nucleoside phosphorylase [Candidatus Schekmanbacteria bacterium]|nr:MTAP family purine nucleoside phosphorylase [Candidatus Schekmanbacteria bacterium]